MEKTEIGNLRSKQEKDRRHMKRGLVRLEGRIMVDKKVIVKSEEKDDLLLENTDEDVEVEIERSQKEGKRYKTYLIVS